MRMLKGRMGPVLLYNMVSEIHKLYARATREEPHHAPNVQEAQDLNSYLHLWNTHKQEKSDLIHIIMKGWRPPRGLQKLQNKRNWLSGRRARPRQHNKRGTCYPITDNC